MVLFSDDLSTLADEDRRLIRTTLDVSRAVDGLGVPGRVRVSDMLPVRLR